MFAWPELPMTTQPPVDGRLLRTSLGAFPTGVCLVTTVGQDGKREGMTINSFSSVSLAPPLVLWSVREAARSADAFLAAPHFVISVLAEDQQDLAMHFARPHADKFADWEDAFDAGVGGCPRLRRSLATYECRLYSSHQEGDHSILVGRVERFSHDDVLPLVFHRGRMGSMSELAEAMLGRGVAA
jgi:flavin reductase (DIM6/NTAB) family NADH-FMN oxidoreductase RutF